MISNCVLTGNSASSGGGSYEGTLNNCTFLGNSAITNGGGSSYGTLNSCILTSNSARFWGGGSYAATLNNCTLTSNSSVSRGGGSYYCTLNNCTLTGNSAFSSGGGSYYGTLNNCILTTNSASSGGGSHYATLNNCTLISNSASTGGGSWKGTLNNCILRANAASTGGGSYYGTLNSCILTANSASTGGGSDGSTLNNCTLTGNSATNGGGSYQGTLSNCIVYYNNAAYGSNYDSTTVSYSCTAPLTSGTGNITNAPMFVDRSAGDFRLARNSPCIDAGNDSVVQAWLDLDGQPRLVGAHVDMGAYEYQFVPPAFAGLVWVTNTVAEGGSVSVSARLAPNTNRPSFQWYLNGTTLLPGRTVSTLALNPVKLSDAGVYSVVVSNAYGSVTGAVMTLKVTFQIGRSVCSLVNTNFGLSVQAEANRAYWLEMRTNLTEGGWQFVAGLTNYTGWANLTDTNACDRQRFYRVGVK